MPYSSHAWHQQVEAASPGHESRITQHDRVPVILSPNHKLAAFARLGSHDRIHCVA